jgi:hypothetical protein
VPGYADLRPVVAAVVNADLGPNQSTGPALIDLEVKFVDDNGGVF